jgi:hypothetical protein
MEETNAEYGCVLQIFTKDDHPNIVTEITGIEASHFRVKGMPKINRKTGNTIGNYTYRENVWFLELSHEGDTWDFSEGLDPALNKILQIILSNEEKFRAVFNKYEYYRIMCYGYIYDFHIVFKLQEETLKKMGLLEIPIEFDFYSFKEESTWLKKIKNYICKPKK